jgi:hypothetical protein
MDKFGILGVRNAWYDPSKVTDHVIQGYTKVRFLHCIQENCLVINFFIMLQYAKSLFFLSAVEIQGLGEGSGGAHDIHDHRFCIHVKSTSLKEAFRDLMPRFCSILLLVVFI